MNPDFEYRSGIGYDIHRLGSDDPLVLGGVAVPYDLGLVGHSDADVLTHAIIDALLGAVGAEDIGQHFPDSDPEYEDISSLKLLAGTRHILEEHGAEVVNIDATVVAEGPRLWPHFQEMRTNLAEELEIDIDRINLKATSGEEVGPEGREEAISAHATCMVRLQLESAESEGDTGEEQSEQSGDDEPLYERSEEQKAGDLAILEEAGQITVNLDGASRGNPGPACAAAVITDPDGHALYPLWEELDEMTSNRAEYSALTMALEFLVDRGWQDKAIEVLMDSELVVKQIRGEYRVKSDNLQDIWQDAKQLLGEFSDLELNHVPRSQNQLADRLANEVLDDS